MAHNKSQQLEDKFSLSLQNVDIYVVLDFEATCERSKNFNQQEIIEFPMVLVDARKNVLLAEFQRYVKPIVNPTLSEFCIELTGITQDVVDKAETFPVVFNAALQFLQANNCGETSSSRSCLFVTCGDWDLKTMLPRQLQITAKRGCELVVPSFFGRWCNLKRLMQDVGLITSGCKFDLPEMLAAVNLNMSGRHHSGIDDCRNIAAVLQVMIQNGCVIAPTSENNNILQGSKTLFNLHVATGRPLFEIESKKTFLSKSNVKTTVKTKRNSDYCLPNSQAMKVFKRPHVDIIANHDPLPGLLKEISLDETKKVSYSKSLSKILRHTADSMGISISDEGYVYVDDILRFKPFCGDSEAVAHIAHVVQTNEKKRFKLAFDNSHRLCICATQGHSLPGINPELRRITSAAEVLVAVHGTYYHAWEEIRKCGFVSTMKRQHIHFARGFAKSSGVISGMRSNVQVYLFLDVEKALGDGVELWESANGVLLTPGVGDTGKLPLCYIAKVVDRKTGLVLLTN